MESSSTARTGIVLAFGVVAVGAGALGFILAQATAHVEPDPQWRLDDPVVESINRGVALMEQYDYAGAVEAFEAAYKADPSHLDNRVNLAIARFNRAAKGDVQAVQQLLDDVLAEDPDHLRALYVRGIAYVYDGQDEKAIPCFEKVLAARPGASHAWYMLARSKSHLGQPCRDELKRAIQENPALASAYYHLMRVALQEGKQEEARQYRETFTRLDDHPLAEKVVMPQYQEMGPLAVVASSSARPGPLISTGEIDTGRTRTLIDSLDGLTLAGPAGDELAGPAGAILARHGVGVAMADVNGDGHLDIATTAALRDGRRTVALLIGSGGADFEDATATSGLTGVRNAISCAFGDYDNDDKVDLYVSCAGPNYLFRGTGEGAFEDVTESTRTSGGNVITASTVFLDADHDADLDLYVCNLTTLDGSAPAANQLLNNNADGTFKDIAASGGVACNDQRSVMMAHADLDSDRDADLVVFNEGAPIAVFMNDRLGKYHAGQIAAEPITAEFGGVLQDFNGDGRPDLLVSPGPDALGRLFLSQAGGLHEPSEQFDGVVDALATWGATSATRCADVDLDGDLDIAVFTSGDAPAGHLLLNDRLGRFVLRANLWSLPAEEPTIGFDLAELSGDGIPDLVHVTSAGDGRIKLIPTRIEPAPRWLAITPTGDRGADERTRSPASGYGTRIEVQAGIHRQVVNYTGLSGGLNQSRAPLLVGLHGAKQADYVFMVWPDGVTQSEIALTAGQHHPIREFERKLSSCPVLFAWDGERFDFVTDFAGVGGLGYFVAPGVYAPPQVLEHVKIEADQLVARDGKYELRVCEPMEEVGYIDRLELLAVDHPRQVQVFPDERLAMTGPAPTHRLLRVDEPIFPARAVDTRGNVCTENLARVDRVYAYKPDLDRRFLGFAAPHELTLAFDERLAEIEPGRPVHLFMNGWIEYPYSQTTYAAGQAGVTWEPMTIECRSEGGAWEVIVPDAGAFGGMGRMITIDLTGKLPAGPCELRIRTNLEMYYDQVFIAADAGTDDLAIRTVPMASAEVRRLGFPLEYSPDGRHPLIYTYDIIEPTSPFKLPRGDYTRYGPVEPLLESFDDRYVILGSGDEIAVSFDATALPPVSDGDVRSFILVSHAYCKDMDLYTAEPDTVGPLPFKEMSGYPYPSSESFPGSDAIRRYQEQYNSRVVQ